MTVKELNAKVEQLEARVDDVSKFYYESTKEYVDLVDNLLNDSKLLMDLTKKMVNKVKFLEKQFTVFALISTILFFILFIS